MSTNFKIKPIGGSLATVACPDPNDADWAPMNELETGLDGRAIHQGFWRVTLNWELMADEDFGALMTLWRGARSAGYLVEQIQVPTLEGTDNSVYGLYNGPPSQYIRMLVPQGKRIILHVQDVHVVFEAVSEGV